jgi:hypothetical protein
MSLFRIFNVVGPVTNDDFREILSEAKLHYSEAMWFRHGLIEVLHFDNVLVVSDANFEDGYYQLWVERDRGVLHYARAWQRLFDPMPTTERGSSKRASYERFLAASREELLRHLADGKLRSPANRPAPSRPPILAPGGTFENWHEGPYPKSTGDSILLRAFDFSWPKGEKHDTLLAKYGFAPIAQEADGYLRILEGHGRWFLMQVDKKQAKLTISELSDSGFAALSWHWRAIPGAEITVSRYRRKACEQVAELFERAIGS